MTDFLLVCFVAYLWIIIERQFSIFERLAEPYPLGGLLNCLLGRAGIKP